MNLINKLGKSLLAALLLTGAATIVPREPRSR